MVKRKGQNRRKDEQAVEGGREGEGNVKKKHEVTDGKDGRLHRENIELTEKQAKGQEALERRVTTKSVIVRKNEKEEVMFSRKRSDGMSCGEANVSERCECKDKG